MSIRNYSRSKVEQGIARFSPVTDNRLRVLFVQNRITDENFDQACRLYANLEGAGYDDVIVIESLNREQTKLLPMISDSALETPFGTVPVNDVLRNDFCDEDDDFYIDDSGFSEDMAVFDHLMMLQCVFSKFRVLSIQMTTLRPSIVRELAAAVSELMRDRNALVVICADATNAPDGALEKVGDMINNHDMLRLMNFLNTGDAGIVGAGPVAAGALIAKEWELATSIYVPQKGEKPSLSGFARLQLVPESV